MDLFTITGVGTCPGCGLHAALRATGHCAHCQLNPYIMSKFNLPPWASEMQVDDGRQWVLLEDASDAVARAQQPSEVKELIDQVKRMRVLQKNYFKYKREHDLREAKNVEARVDRILQAIELKGGGHG